MKKERNTPMGDGGNPNALKNTSRAICFSKQHQKEKTLTIVSVNQDESCNPVLNEYHVKPETIFLTTTDIEVSEELLNRCIVLSVDESQPVLKESKNEIKEKTYGPHI